MSRFLFVVPPLTGHVRPLLGVAAELEAGGHQVTWVGPQPAVGELARGRLSYHAGRSQDFALDRRPPNLRGFAALKFLWEDYLVPLADAMADGVESAVRDFAPDVLVADQQAMAGALVAHGRGLPWATSASTSAELSDPVAAMPKVRAWIDRLQDKLRSSHGVTVHSGAGDLRFSPHLVLAFTTEMLAGAPAVSLPGPLRYVGPSLLAPSPQDFPWDQLDARRPLVLVTLGTANGPASGRFLAESALALGDLAEEFQGVIADPDGLLPDLLPGVERSGVVVVRRIPQLELISRAAVVVCHGGHNTVCESLSHGVPLVIAPIRDDQPVLAEQVSRAGAGCRLRFDRARARDIRTAILQVTSRPRYAEDAQRIQRSFVEAGGQSAAAGHLAALARA